jgi:segregation and condensation protein B
LDEVLDGATREEIRAILDELQRELENHRRGVRLIEVAGGFQLRTPKVNADWVKKLLGGRPARMSRATLETLAIIAYRQPVTKAEIEAIRGVDVDGVVNTLLERGLIRAVARKDVPGRPFLYGTTPEFLQLFNLKDLSYLPTLKEMEEITLPEPPGEVVLLDINEER